MALGMRSMELIMGLASPEFPYPMFTKWQLRKQPAASSFVTMIT